MTAEEVLGNIDAMAAALEAAESPQDVTAETILEIHRLLLQGSGLDEFGGRIREVQNWIGGSSYNPCSAAFVPPPPGLVPGLLEDLARFCNDNSLPAVAQAAILHAQFETIHPFVDGNGRTGRALIHMILRRRGLAPRVVPPVSLVLATLSRDYISGLTAFRYENDAMSAEAHVGFNTWVGMFAGCCIRSVSDAGHFERQVREIQGGWRQCVGPVRGNSTVDLLIQALPGTPIVTVNGAAKRLGRSFRATNQAIDELVKSGVLTQTTVGKRNRVFEAAEIIDAFTALERRLASPASDTRIEQPARVVPVRSR